MQRFEVEIKSLLGDSDKAETLRKAMKSLDPSCELLSENRQLNHYFEGGSLRDLAEKVSPKLSTEAGRRISEIVVDMANSSVRTRYKDDETFLIVKTTLRDDTSENGVARVEFEERLPSTLTELDNLVMSSGFRYQAKWSRQREEYLCRGINVTLDKNAGYGWLAEFERIVDDPLKVDDAEREIRTLMQELGAQELPQERLERMFKHYNKHWQDYYGTDKIFIVE